MFATCRSNPYASVTAVQAYDGPLVGGQKAHPTGVIPPLVDPAESLLHIACRRGNSQLFDFLLARGCPMDARDGWGRTPFHSGLYGGHLAMVDRLVGSHYVDGREDDVSRPKSGTSVLDYASNRAIRTSSGG